MILDKYFSKEYDAKNYNCSHFVRDVWLELKGSDLTAMLCAWNSGNLIEAIKHRKDLTKLDKPVDPCIILFQKPNTPPHAAIWIDGGVFHLTDNGARLDDFDCVSSCYQRWNFYLC